MKVYGDGQSGNCYKIKLAASILDVSHEWVEVDMWFTADDRELLLSTLDGLRSETGRGTTNLYGAYMQAISLVDGRGASDAVVERFVVGVRRVRIDSLCQHRDRGSGG